MTGFIDFIEKVTILKSELWIVCETMVLIKEKDWLNVIVEVDSENVMDLINSEYCEDHHLKVIIKDCKKIAVEMRLQVCHTLREGTRCADAIAKLGFNQMKMLQVFQNILASVKELLQADEIRVNYPRGF